MTPHSRSRSESTAESKVSGKFSWFAGSRLRDMHDALTAVFQVSISGAHSPLSDGLRVALTTEQTIRSSESRGTRSDGMGAKRSGWHGRRGTISPAPRPLTNHFQVQGEAQGDAEAIENLIRDMNAGPPAARVERLEHDVMEAKEGETEFDVRSTV